MNPLLLRYLPHLIIGAVVLAALTWGAYTINRWRSASHELPRVQAAYEAYRTEAQRQFKIAYDSSKGYQDELTKLRTARTPLPPVRLCRTTHPLPAPAASRRPDAGATRAGDIPRVDAEDHREGPDIAPDLAALAERADEILAQCRGLQQFILSQ